MPQPLVDTTIPGAVRVYVCMCAPQLQVLLPTDAAGSGGQTSATT